MPTSHPPRSRRWPFRAVAHAPLGALVPVLVAALRPRRLLRRRGRAYLMEQLLALEMVRVTEEAAIASARSMGRGDRMGADKLATESMRRTMDEIDFAGRIVIGEGERDEAPMLYIGEEVGRRRLRDPDAVAGGHRRRPARRHEPRRPRPGRRDHRARRVGGRRPDPRPRHLHGEAVRRAGRGRQGRHPRVPHREPRSHRRGARPAGRRHHRRHPGAASPRRAHRRGPRRRGPDQAHRRRRPVGRDLDARSPARASTRSWARAAPRGRHHGRGAALSRRRDPGPLPLSERRGTRARRPDGPRRRGAGST